MEETLNNDVVQENEKDESSYIPNEFELLNSRYYMYFNEYTINLTKLTDGVAKAISKNLLNKYNQEFKLISYNDKFDFKLAIKEKKRFRKLVKFELKKKIKEENLKKLEQKKKEKGLLKRKQKKKKTNIKTNKLIIWIKRIFVFKAKKHKN